MIIENRLTLFLLIFLATLSSAGVYWIHRLSLQQEKNYGHYPTSIGYRLIADRYDTVGVHIDTLTAETAYQYSDTKTTEFNLLNLQAYGKITEPPWNITAPKGIAYDKGEKLEVLGSVNMQKAANAAHPFMQIKTANVTIYPNQKQLTTQAAVHAMQPGITVDGVGANYDYGNQTLHLLSQVHVQYQPKEVQKST